jgi:hypothetical protein
LVFIKFGVEILSRAWLSHLERTVALVSSAKRLGYTVILVVSLQMMLFGSNLGEVLTDVIDFNE